MKPVGTTIEERIAAPDVPPRPSRDEAGMTLVEVMVAILVVGLVLAALASVLTTSLRAIVQNERESTATAFAQQEIERMQAVDWEYAGLLETEVAAAPASWSARLDDPTTFRGEELAQVVAPSGATSRPEQIPHLTSQITRQNTTYDVARYATWVDRTGNGSDETRRFTVVMSWEVLGKPREITVTAERIPTLAEAVTTESGIRLLNFFRSPDPSQLDGEGLLTQPLRVEVRLSQGVTGGRLRYHTAVPVETDPDGDGLLPPEITSIDYELQDVPMSPVGAALAGGGYAVWELTISSGDGRFVEGIMPLQFVANELDGAAFEVYGSVKLIGSEVAGTYPNPPSLTGTTSGETSTDPVAPVDGSGAYTGDVTITSATIVNTPCRNPTTWKLSQDLLVRVQVQGLTEFDPVEATYTYRSHIANGNNNRETATEPVDYVSGNEAGAVFELTLPAGGDRFFREGDRIDFHVAARRDAQNDSLTTASVAFVNQGTSPC